MAKRDYYDILSIGKGSSEGEIKRAYRRLAMQYHPDKNQNDAEAAQKMKEINEAYAVLSDSQKRQIYDTYGHAGLEGYSTSDIFSGVDFDSLFREFGLGGFGGSIFESFFGTGRSSTHQRNRGADLRYDLEVTLEEVAAGVEKKIKIPHKKACQACKGTGAKAEGLKTCDHCKGTGQMVREQRTGFGVFRQISTCGHCNGQGRLVKEKCEECRGNGYKKQVTELSIAIPRGAGDDYSLKIAGEGEAGTAGAEPGDLYVVLNVAKHNIFERHGDDIYMAREISFVDATLGGEIEDLPSLNGRLKLEIPEGTHTGTVLRLTDKGIPHLKGSGHGDLYVVVKVLTPQNLGEKQKELLREFSRLERTQ